MLKMFKKEIIKDFEEELLAGITRDGYTITPEELQKARENDTKTLYNIGCTYLRRDKLTAFKWFHKAACQNHPAAQLQVADMYWEGQCVNKSYDKAMKWYRKAAEHDIVEAEYNIGNLYKSGFGMYVDYKKSMEWYLKAADKGYADAQNDIGYLYHLGLGVIKNIDTAIQWYIKASHQNHGKAQENMGIVYQYEYEMQDLQEAVYWYQKAADNGITNAKQTVKALNRQGYFARPKPEDEKPSLNNHNNQNMETIVNDLQLRIIEMEKEHKKNKDALQRKIRKLQHEKLQKDQDNIQLKLKLATLEAQRDINYDINYDSDDQSEQGNDARNADPNSSDNEDRNKDICYD